MAECGEENGFARLDRKIGLVYSRSWGLVLVGIALLIAYFTLTSDGFTLATHWPGIAVAAFLLVLARFCYGSREGMLDLLSDTHASKPRTAPED